MGMTESTMTIGYNEWKEPDLHPNRHKSPTFDPNYGFPNGRKEREPTLSYDEMVAHKVPEEYRDYCAHYYVDMARCYRKVLPFNYRCSHEKHHWDQCQYEEMISRMKEYEREKRLIQRAARKKMMSPVDEGGLEE
ncbi:NADH dehydrogenase [ubiquinone] 1 beta subcomplex subunit 7-like [Pecten maximus]|uniref:NADH dehydrogenase [ubiquinone] 1 beta subcomplex subunit 7-like n=1 Tax=Pecten maximus TaxID=6579 RepID=UPI00145885EC|nr:NADH dehydrogenase [ubiquinone] 1 beta subcomplex subunit 7-like [Pecten maximus]